MIRFIDILNDGDLNTEEKDEAGEALFLGKTGFWNIGRLVSCQLSSVG